MAMEELQQKTDLQLMELVCRENLKSAYDVLVLRHYQDAIRYCRSMIHDESMAYDLVQDSFVDLYVQRARYPLSADFHGYLLSVVRHKSIDWLRKSGLRYTEELDDTSAAGTGPSPEDLLLKQEDHEQLAQWIAELPEDYRQVLLYYCLDGLSYQETASAMKRTVPQIKILLYRARKKLKQRRRESR